MSNIARYSLNFVKDGLFGKYLLFTNTCIGGSMMLTGDFIQQKIEAYRGKSERYDSTRGGNMAVIGMTMAPIQHFVYKYMEVLWPGRDTKTVIKKLFCDQATVAPICIGIFFFGINYLEGKGSSEAFDELKKKFLPVYAADCAIWVPCQMINFLYLPAKFRVLYVNFILVGYNIFLSYIKYKDKNEVVEKQH